MAEPVLNLDTLVERRVVVIDGKHYELKNPDEVSLLDYHRIWYKGRELDAAFAKPNLTMDEIGALAKNIDELCRFLLDAPDAVHARLHESHKMKVIQVFTSLQHAAVTAPAPEPPATPSSGETSSPESSGSTAGTP